MGRTGSVTGIATFPFQAGHGPFHPYQLHTNNDARVPPPRNDNRGHRDAGGGHYYGSADGKPPGPDCGDSQPKHSRTWSRCSYGRGCRLCAGMCRSRGEKELSRHTNPVLEYDPIKTARGVLWIGWMSQPAYPRGRSHRTADAFARILLVDVRGWETGGPAQRRPQCETKGI